MHKLSLKYFWKFPEKDLTNQKKGDTMKNMNNNINTKKVFFGTPVRDKEKSIPFFLEGFYRLEYPKNLIDVYFLVNDSKDKSYAFLKEYERRWGNIYNSFKIEVLNFNFPQDFRDRASNPHTYAHLASLRNIVRDRFLKSDCQYWFHVDADHLIPSNSLNQMLFQEKGIISGWTEHCWKNRTNVLVKKGEEQKVDAYRLLTADFISGRGEELIPVDWVGGFSLIRRDIADLCKYFSPFLKEQKSKDMVRPPASFEQEGFVYRFCEESLGFCMMVQGIGETVWVDPKLKYIHHGMEAK